MGEEAGSATGRETPKSCDLSVCWSSTSRATSHHLKVLSRKQTPVRGLGSLQLTDGTWRLGEVSGPA